MKDAAPRKAARPGGHRRKKQPPSGFDETSVMRRDLFRLRQLETRDPAGFAALLESSRAALVERQASQARIEFPSVLPISAHASEICDLLKSHQVIVVAGETGSGKTTQLPKICLQAGFGRRGMIGHTQPRRLAARSVASRIAEELQVALGQAVGYAVRFSDQTGPQTLIKLVTDGLLLTEIRRDRFLDNYDVIIELRDAAGRTVAGWRQVAGGLNYPSALWPEGFPVREVRVMPRIGAVPAGEYLVTLRLERSSDGLSIPARTGPFGAASL